MPSEWRETTLGDLVELQRGTTYKSRLLGLPGPALLGLATIQRNGGFRSDIVQTYGGESPKKLLLEPGDLYVSLKDVTQAADLLGAIARVPRWVAVGRLTQDTVKLVFKRADIPRSLVYWLLRTPQYRNYCRARATGTTNLGLSRDDFLAYPVPESSPARRALVDLLDALDDKIELNRKMNETLEQMARAIFKACFTYPYEGLPMLMAGKPPSSRPSPTGRGIQSEGYLELVDSPLGRIPKGWGVGRLDDLLVLQRGFDLPMTDRRHGPHPVMAASGPSGGHAEFMVKGPGVTTGRSGLLGQVFFVHEDFWPLNTSLWVKEYRRSRPVHAYHVLQSLDFASFNAGSAVPTLNRNHVHNLPVVVPPVDVVERYEQIGMSLFRRTRLSIAESRTLAAIRDALLPKLMSGEVRVAS